MADERVQFNARIAKNYKRNIKTDAAKSDITIDTITEAIIARFYREVPTFQAREEMFRAHEAGKA